VSKLLRGGKPTEALALLSEDPRLAWVKDSQSGGYPAHIAAHKVCWAATSKYGHIAIHQTLRELPAGTSEQQQRSVQQCAWLTGWLVHMSSRRTPLVGVVLKLCRDTRA
jgi:hypothetical protein